MKTYADLKLPVRTLLGAGPSDVDPRVLRVMATPVIGFFDPEFLAIMDETMELTRFVFQTENEFTFTLPATGTGGMETALANMIEPGDRMVVCVNGFFGARMTEMVKRLKGELVTVEAPWGQVVDPADVERALKGGKTRVVAIVHAETSTGILQPLEEIARLAKEHGALLLVDAVTSLGGVEVNVDKRGIDICYSGSQKCLGAPPGMSLITLNSRAQKALASRKTEVHSWYLDLGLIQRYWAKERFYHHTAPASLIYAMRESLRLVYEEGLEARFARHELNSTALKAGLEAMGLKLFAEAGHRNPTLTTIAVPDGVNDANMRGKLLKEYNIEISGGLGQLKGKIWRIGLMGNSSKKRNVIDVLAALEGALRSEGLKAPSGAGIAAAEQAYKG
ncbi:MAG: alanine--glyoxylate aminotransferase family protein [Firmicutes bacterium]|nr:alanine--glyoxylate aminotransferase family protein [Bacillota bacterium]